MKKQIFILASALLLASCGNNNGSAYSEKKGTPITDNSQLVEPLGKFSEAMASTKVLGIDAKVVGNAEVALSTKANSAYGTKDATYNIKGSTSGNLSAAIDFENAKASATLNEKLSASGKLPGFDVDTAGNVSLLEQNLNIPETNLAAKLFLDDAAYVDVSGAKAGIVTIANAYLDGTAGAQGSEAKAAVSSAIAEIPDKFKTGPLGEEVSATIKSLPETVGGVAGMLATYLTATAQLSSVPADPSNPLSLLKFEKVDNDYRASVDLEPKTFLPMLFNSLPIGVEYEQLAPIFDKATGNLHASITFNEKALVSANFGVNLAVKDVDGAVLSGGQETFFDKLSASLDFGVGVNFKTSGVSVATLSASEKEAYRLLETDLLPDGGDIEEE